MTRADLQALAARVEQAQGPDRALDSGIAQAVGWVERDDGYGMNSGWFPPHDVSAPAWFEQRGRHAYGFDVLPFTASLDAALTLVPEGWRLIALGCDGEHWHCVLANQENDTVAGDAIDEPRARTAAALRALAEGGSDE